MTDFLPETKLELSECADIQSKTYRNFKKNKFYTSVGENYENNTDWWKTTRDVLNNTREITTALGNDICLAQTDKKYDQYVDAFLSCPAVFKSFEVWALVKTIIKSELDFLSHCVESNNEVSLTAYLLGLLQTHSKYVQEEHEKHLALNDSVLNVSKLELQVQNREKKIGGDFALLFEWKNEQGEICIAPIIFQAKRVSSLLADISQKNKSTGQYQLDTLINSSCNSCYIFYNCDTQATTPEPRLPTVKKTENIKISNGEYTTNTVEDCLSLSIYFIDIISNANAFTTTSRSDALKKITADANLNDLHEVITLSVDPNAKMQYEIEYKALVEKTQDNNVNKPTERRKRKY